jgi:hypothetical protein
MPVKFAISTLKPGVDPKVYEEWVRDRDYGLVKKMPNFISYKVHRIEGPITGIENVGWNYLERIEVRSLEQHQRDLASPDGQELLAELYGRYLDRSKTIYFTSTEV